MVSVIHHPHDKLFQLSMEEPRVYQEFLSAHLPADLLKRINCVLPGSVRALVKFFNYDECAALFFSLLWKPVLIF